MKFQLIFIAAIVGICHSKSVGSSDISDLTISGLMGDFDFNPQELMKNMKEELKEECHNLTGSDDAYNSIKDKPDELLVCLLDAINLETYMGELEKAIETSNYDALFTKTCHISREAMPCVENFAKSLEICMDEEEKQLSDLLLIMTKALMDFVCSKDISELEAIFSAPEDECIMSKTDEAMECGNTTMAKYFVDDDDEETQLKNIHKLLTQEEGCRDILDFEACALGVFDSCENKAPINIIRDAFKSVVNQTPCKDVTRTPVTVIVDNNL